MTKPQRRSADRKGEEYTSLLLEKEAIQTHKQEEDTSILRKI